MTADELARRAGIELPPVATKRARKTLEATAAEESLLAALRKPGGAKPWNDYATWLCSRGDPFGRLAIAGRAGRELAEREAELLARHGEALLGPLRPWVDRGWLDITWRHGYFKYVQVQVDEPLGLREQDLVGALFDHPSAQILGELRLSGFDIRAYEQQKLVDAVIERRPQTLRELEVSGVMGMSCGDLARVWGAFPKLRSLSAFGRDVELGEIDAPELALLDIYLRELTTEVIERIVVARVPKLTTLRLAGVDSKQHLGVLKPILDAKLPALQELLLTGVEGSDALAAAILDSPKLTCVAFWNSDLGKPAAAKLKKRFGDKLYL